MRVKLLLSVILVVMVIVSNGIIYAQSTPESEELCGVGHWIIYNIQLSPNGQYVSANWPPHSVRVWNAETGAIVATLTDEIIDEDETFVFSPDNKLIMTGGNAGISILWDVVSGERLRTFVSQKVDVEQIKSISFSPDSKSAIVTYRYSHSLWDLNSGNEAIQFSVIEPQEAGILSEISPNGKFILTQNSRGGPNIRIWDIKSHELLYTFDKIVLGGIGMFSPDGEYILIPKRDYTVLADANTYRTVRNLDAASDWRFSPNGKYLLADKEQSIIGVWDVKTGKFLHEFRADTGFGIRASFLENDLVLLPHYSNSTQTLISLHDIKTGDELRKTTIGISLQDIMMALVSLDGQYLAITSTSGVDGIVTAWDIQTGKQIRKYC